MAKNKSDIKLNKLKHIPLPRLANFIYDKKQQFINQSEYQPISPKDYEASCEKAELLGYKRVEDLRAYGKAYYVDQNGKIWIHRIANLAYKMGFQTLQDAEDAGYNVDDYFKYIDFTPEEISNLEMVDLYNQFRTGIYDDELIYLSDGVYLNAEGEWIDTKPYK
jgi:hypothetical protein